MVDATTEVMLELLNIMQKYCLIIQIVRRKSGKNDSIHTESLPDILTRFACQNPPPDLPTTHTNFLPATQNPRQNLPPDLPATQNPHQNPPPDLPATQNPRQNPPPESPARFAHHTESPPESPNRFARHTESPPELRLRVFIFCDTHTQLKLLRDTGHKVDPVLKLLRDTGHKVDPVLHAYIHNGRKDLYCIKCCAMQSKSGAIDNCCTSLFSFSVTMTPIDISRVK
jgi:hypothetical protein